MHICSVYTLYGWRPLSRRYSMFYIEEADEVPLPEKYHKANNLCALIYDQIVEVLVDERYSALTKFEFEIDPKSKGIEELLSDKIHFFDWLRLNEFNDELTSVLTGHLAMSIVSDFSNFIHESCSCAQRGKMTVAYALLRKPFTDELLILEQLLNDPSNFVARFFHEGDPENYDPSSSKIDKRNIISSATDKINSGLIFTPEMIYDLRYDKSSRAGINGISNQALHIVTKDKNYRTSKQNLNFVFSTKDDFNKYWDHYYYFVPYLLIYAASIIDLIVFKCLPDSNEDISTLKQFRRLLGTIFWSEGIDGKETDGSRRMLAAVSSEIEMYCNTCKKNIGLERADFELFFNSNLFLCPTCFSNLADTKKTLKSIRTLIKTLTNKDGRQQ